VLTAALVVAILGTLAAPAAWAASLKADYRFNNTLASSVAGAPSATNIATLGPNGFTTETVRGSPGRVLTFPQGNGVQISTAGVIPVSAYTIVVVFRFSDIGGYRRIIDFKSGTSDRGLYDLNGQLVFYSTASGSQSPPPITPSAHGDPYHEVALSRSSSGLVIGTVDGVEQFQFQDTNGDAVIDPGQALRFFKDDAVVPGEQSGGAVANIRLYDRPLPQPVLGKAVGASTIKGTVLVGVPGPSGVHFATLTRGQLIPVGSILDTRRGTVSLTSAADRTGATQSGNFAGGVFKLFQARTARAVTELRLTGSSFASCTRGKRARSARGRPNSIIRTLRSSARGRFRTTGRYSAGTVRGTEWTISDRCDGTLTTVRRGTVSVRDFRRRRTVLVRAGHSYLARAK
jgi:hypothetical protein